jgi:hypothetical protein
MIYVLDRSLLSWNLRESPRFNVIQLHWSESHDHMSASIYCALLSDTRK